MENLSGNSLYFRNDLAFIWHGVLFFDVLFQSSACHLDDRFLKSTICIEYSILFTDSSLMMLCKLLQGRCQTKLLTSLKFYMNRVGRENVSHSSNKGNGNEQGYRHGELHKGG